MHHAALRSAQRYTFLEAFEEPKVRHEEDPCHAQRGVHSSGFGEVGRKNQDERVSHPFEVLYGFGVLCFRGFVSITVWDVSGEEN